MRLFVLFLFLVLLLADVSFAQSSMLAGKIVDEHNMPIASAKIKIKKRGRVAEAKSDNDGLFYSKLVPVGYYRIGVVVDGKYMKTRSVYLPDETKKKSYFYLRVVGDKVIVATDAEDPFMKVKLTKIEKDRHNIDGDNIFIMKIDSATGKVISETGCCGHLEQVREAH